jgi:hypothetical protein
VYRFVRYLLSRPVSVTGYYCFTYLSPRTLQVTVPFCNAICTDTFNVPLYRRRAVFYSRNPLYTNCYQFYRPRKDRRLGWPYLYRELNHGPPEWTCMSEHTQELTSDLFIWRFTWRITVSRKYSNSARVAKCQGAQRSYWHLIDLTNWAKGRHTKMREILILYWWSVHILGSWIYIYISNSNCPEFLLCSLLGVGLSLLLFWTDCGLGRLLLPDACHVDETLQKHIFGSSTRHGLCMRVQTKRKQFRCRQLHPYEESSSLSRSTDVDELKTSKFSRFSWNSTQTPLKRGKEGQETMKSSKGRKTMVWNSLKVAAKGWKETERRQVCKFYGEIDVHWGRARGGSEMKRKCLEACFMALGEWSPPKAEQNNFWIGNNA